MNFAIQNNVAGGRNAAALRAQRGADPLIVLPPGHILHRVAGISFRAAPGGGALHFNAVAASIVEAVMMGAAYFDARLSGAAMSAPVMLVMVRPAKFDAIMAQLYAEPQGIGLDPHRLYDSLSDAAADVCATAARLDVLALHPAYVITPADLIDLEPVTRGAGQRLTDICVGANALTFKDLVGEAGFATHTSFLYYCWVDRCIAGTRDANGSAVRKVLSLLEVMAERAGCLSPGSALSGTALAAWLEATTLPAGLHLLRESGSGVARREQVVRDRHAIFYGSEEQRERLVIGLIAYSPLKQRVPNLLKVIGRGGPEADIRSCVQRLAQHLFGRGSIAVVKVSLLESLEVELKPLMHALSSPTTALIRMDERVALIAKAKREAAGATLNGSASEDKASGSGSQLMSRIKIDVFADALAEAFNTETWSELNRQIGVELERVPLSRLAIYTKLVRSPFVGVIRAAMGYQDAANAPLLRASQALTRAVMELEEWGTLVSNLMVCDMGTFAMTDQHLQRFRLEARVIKTLKRGGFNELDLVADLMLPVMKVNTPELDIDEFSEGLRDARVVGLLAPLLRRLSLALGLPIEPSMPIFEQGLVSGGQAGVVSLCSLVATISAEAIDIASHPSPFNEDDLEQLSLFEATAWTEAAELFHREVVAARNPVGTPLASILPDGSAALSILATMRENKAKRRREAHMYKTLYALQADYRRGELGGRFAVKAERSGRSSPAKPRDRSRSPSTDRSTAGDEVKLSRARRMSGADNPCRHSSDRSRFWFASNETGRRVSPVYDYETLERLGGKPRADVCYPFLLSTKPPHRRMSICERPDELGHRTFTSPAHVPPTADFLEQVNRHFPQPAGGGSSSAGKADGPPSRTTGSKGQHLKDPRSPHPADARRSHGSKGEARSQSASPARRATSASPSSPRPIGYAGKGSPKATASRSASPDRAPMKSEPHYKRSEHRASSPPAPRDAPPSPRPSSSDSGVMQAGRTSPSSRPKRQRTPGVRQVVWGAAAVAAPAQAQGMMMAAQNRATQGPTPLVDVSLPCSAVVRTLLFVVSAARLEEAHFMLPAQPNMVIGSVSALSAPRSAAVAEAYCLAQSLPIPCGWGSVLCVPVFESVPAADDMMAVVDRVVALPLPGIAGMARRAEQHADGDTEWVWRKLSAISCAIVYSLAATVAARLASFGCSIPARVAHVLDGVSTRMRSGARAAKRVKCGGLEDVKQRSEADLGSTDVVSPAWRAAIVSMRATDEALRRALLSIPDEDPMAADLHAFADVIRPVDLTDFPPALLMSASPPDYSGRHLRLLPFSTRVGPPTTLPLPRECQLRRPSPDFQPQTWRDLIRPFWVKRVEEWYDALKEWLVSLAEVAQTPDSPEAEAVRRARPRTLVVPRSGFVDEAVDVVWDLTGERPIPLDFDAPLETHLNLELIRQWQLEWPDFPDREIFSHLLEGVRFKVQLPYQMVLQPHLASLSYGFVNVHKELIRLIDKGYFDVMPHPPFVPWRTLPSGSVERKHEPGRPRRTEDGSAPRRGVKGAEFMVDKDGVRTLSINLAAAIPADDLHRGTHAVFYDAWERRLSGRYSPRPRQKLGMGQRPPAKGAVLLLFSGEGQSADSLSSRLLGEGLDIIEVDLCVGAQEHDMTNPKVCDRIQQLIKSGNVVFVFAAPPCESGSIAPADSRPCLRSPSQPWGVLPVPKRWKAYLEKHNALIRATAKCLGEASQSGVPWMVENPALRTDPGSVGYWPRFKEWGTLWHCLIDLGIAPDHRAAPGRTSVVGPVVETIVAACAFGAPYQKLTMFWSSQNCEPVCRRLSGRVCTHASHAQQAHGVDAAGRSQARAAAKYAPELASQLAKGIEEVVTENAHPEGRTDACDGAFARPAQPDRRCGRCKRPLTRCDRCHQWCCDTTGCFYVKCICDLPEYAELHDAEVGAAFGKMPPPRSASWSPRPARVTCSDRPAPQALRSGDVVDVNITLESSTPTLANPFLLGSTGKDESLRELAASTYAAFLNLRTEEAASCSRGMPVARKLRALTGEMVLREVERVVSRHPSFARFHLVCRRSCTGKACHGRSLCRLFDEVIQSTQPSPFPKELKPTIPEVLLDLAVLHYVSHHTGVPVIQIVSDVKDFFNQHGLAPSEKPKVGLVTVDPRAIVEYVAQLRAACPTLSNVLAHVLGYGLTPASNVCQRTAHLLTFIWMARMEVAARAIVAAMAVQHPFIAGWLADRRRHFGSPSVGAYARVSTCQARLWTISMYTDDGHQALLGIQLAVCGLRVWREITGSLKLQMAIIQKHGLGQQVTVQGVVVNTGLGVAYVPVDKLRRALSTLEAALRGDLSLADYRSLLGLLQSLLFVAGMNKTSMYGLYAPLSAGLSVEPDELVKMTPWLSGQLEKWRRQLAVKAGSSFMGAVPRLRAADSDDLSAAPAVFFIRSDASKEGVGAAGLGGALGGLCWRFPARGPLEARFLRLPIAALEFIAYVGSIVAFASFIPEHALLVSEVDALATADALTAEAAKSPVMQAIHLELISMPEFARVAERHVVAHVFGEANVVADAVSRDLGDVLQTLAGQLNLRLQFISPPACVPRLLEKMLGVAELAGTSLGMHNPTMTGTPFAQAARMRAPCGGTEKEHGARQDKRGAGAWAIDLAAICGCVTGSCQRPATHFDAQRGNQCDMCEVGGPGFPRCDCDCGQCRPWLSLPKRATERESGSGQGSVAGGGLVEESETSEDSQMEEDGGGECAPCEEEEGESTRQASGPRPERSKWERLLEGESDRKCDCVAGGCSRKALPGARSWDFAFCKDCEFDVTGVRCRCDCGRCRPEGSVYLGPPDETVPEPCMCPSGLCVRPADYFERGIQRFVCAPCGILSDDHSVVCTCDCYGCEPTGNDDQESKKLGEVRKEQVGAREPGDGVAMCGCARVFGCKNGVRGENKNCQDCSTGCSSRERCACPCDGCRAEAEMETRIEKELAARQAAGWHKSEEAAGGQGETRTGGGRSRHEKRLGAAEAKVSSWREENTQSLVWRGKDDWLGRPVEGNTWSNQVDRLERMVEERRNHQGKETAQRGLTGRAEELPAHRQATEPPQPDGQARSLAPPPPPPPAPSPKELGKLVKARKAVRAGSGEALLGSQAPVCRCGMRLEFCGECGSLRCNLASCLFIKCVCDLDDGGGGGRRDGSNDSKGGGSTGGGKGPQSGKGLRVTTRRSPKKSSGGVSGPAADGSAAEAVSEMLTTDSSNLAINPVQAGLGELCRDLYNTSTSQPVRTSQAQASAWEHWVEWCAVNQTNPWRLVTPSTEVERQREAVLMAGFLRFCHQRQSVRPRGGRPAALVTSATKALSHVRKLHKEKGFPMQESALVQAQARRLQLEYKAAHGMRAMQPLRKEPFTRKMLVEMLLLAPDGVDLGGELCLSWDSRFGRSFAGLVTTLVQTGFRKGEVTSDKRCEECPAECLSREAVAWYLRGRMFAGGEAPAEFLLRPQPGDYVVITPGPSKADQLGLVWGGTPIWIPFVEGEPLCAFSPLAQIEMNDECVDRSRTALFTYDDGSPLVAGHMDRVLHRLLLRELPEKTVRLYSWHSARIFLATALRASGASMDETQALCRWQTPASLKIYARMNRERYGSLIARAMRVDISSARANALATAMPFLDLHDAEPELESEWSEGGDEGFEAPLSEVQDEKGDGAASSRSAVAPVEAMARVRRGKEKMKEKSPAKDASKEGRKMPRVEKAGDNEAVEKRYGRVPHFPENLEGYRTFFERPSARRPPRARDEKSKEVE